MRSLDESLYLVFPNATLVKMAFAEFAMRCPHKKVRSVSRIFQFKTLNLIILSNQITFVLH